VNAGILVYQAMGHFAAERDHEAPALINAAMDDILGSVFLQVLLFPGLARVLGAARAHQTSWSTYQVLNLDIEWECMKLLSVSTDFAAIHAAIYAIRPVKSIRDFVARVADNTLPDTSNSDPAYKAMIMIAGK